MNLLAHKFSHLVFPRESNNYRSVILKNSSLLFMSAMFLIIQFFVSFAQTPKLNILGYASQISPSEIIRLSNEKRIENGEGILTENPLLSQAALAKGTHMLQNNYWAHVAPDGTTPWYFFDEVDYQYQFAGENLARDFSNPASAVEAWMASASHRDNLLSSRYDEIGVAVVEGDLNGVDTTIIVQLFGKKASSAASVPVVAAQNEGSTIEEKVVESNTKVASEVPNIVEYQNYTGVSTQKQVSPLDVTKVISFGLIGLFALALMIDMLIITRRKITRVAGRSFAHLAFFRMILAIIMIAKAGSII